MAITSATVRAAAFVIVAGVSAVGLVAQTPVQLPKNRYTPEQDVEAAKPPTKFAGSIPSSTTRGSPAISAGSAIGSWRPHRRS